MNNIDKDFKMKAAIFPEINCTRILVLKFPLYSFQKNICIWTEKICNEYSYLRQSLVWRQKNHRKILKTCTGRVLTSPIKRSGSAGGGYLQPRITQKSGIGLNPRNSHTAGLPLPRPNRIASILTVKGLWWWSLWIALQREEVDIDFHQD